MAFPQSDERAVIEALMTVLRTDPMVSTEVESIVRLADGAETAPDVAFAPDESQLPMLRVRFTGYPTKRWMEAGIHKGDLNIEFDLYVAGLDEADIFDFWAAVRTALFPRDQTRRDEVKALMENANLISGRFTEGASNIDDIGQAKHGLKARARMALTMMSGR